MPKNVINGAFVTSDGEVPSAAEWNSLGIFGDGSDGSYTSGDNLTPGKVYNFTTFTLNSGDTLTSTTSSNEPLVILVQGDVDISGTIDLRGKSNGGILPYSAGLKSDGQNGGATTSTDRGEGKGGRQFPKDEYFNAITGSLRVPAGSDGGKGGDAEADIGGGGGGGGAAFDANGNDGARGNTGDGFRGGTQGPGGAGGAGGGALIIITNGNFNFDGTIDIRGEDGEAGADVKDSGAGGGGGGGGGSAHIIYSGNLSNNGNTLIAGGNGGAGGQDTDNEGGDGGRGGDGANGTIIFEPVS